VALRDLVYRLRDELEHEVEVQLVALLPVGVEEAFELANVGVLQQLHNLELAVLEAPVLQHLLDRDDLARLLHRRLEHHPKRPVVHDPLRLKVHRP